MQFPKSPVLFVIFCLLMISITTAFVPGPIEQANPQITFILGPPSKPLTNETKLKLGTAYKAQFGKNAKIDRIEVIRHQGKDYLAIQSGGNGSPTFAVQLSIKAGNWVIERGVVTNTCTGDPCSWCYWNSDSGCHCNAKGGGTCNHTQTSLRNFSKFSQTLGL